jgi:hypothetical protein
VTPEPRNLSAFIRSVEAELQLRGVEFSLCDLLSWAVAVWPIAREEPDPGRWGDAFLEGHPPARPTLTLLPGSAGPEDVLALYRHLTGREPTAGEAEAVRRRLGPGA